MDKSDLYFLGNVNADQYVKYPRLKNFHQTTKFKIGDLIFNFLEIGPLTKLGMTSKKWKTFTNNAPVWIDLCTSAGVFPESKPSLFLAIEQNNTFVSDCLANYFSEHFSIDTAINYLSHEIFAKNSKFQVENWLNLLRAKKIFLTTKADNEVTQICIDLGKLQHASSLIATDKASVNHHFYMQTQTSWAKEIRKRQLDIYKQLSKEINNADDRSQCKIQDLQLLIAKQHLENQASFLADFEVSYLLKKIIDNQYGTKKQRLQAEYIKAVFTCQDRDKNWTHPFAFHTFKKIRDSTEVDQELVLNANYQIALMHAQDMIYTSDYDQVAKTFLMLINDKNTSLEMQANANYYLAELVFNGSTKMVSMEKAFALVENALAGESLPKNLVRNACLLLKQKTSKLSMKKEIDLLSSKHTSDSESSFEDIFSLLTFEFDSSLDSVHSLQMKDTIKQFPSDFESECTQHLNSKNGRNSF